MLTSNLSRRAPFAICILMLASLLTPFAMAGNGSGTITTFADGNPTSQLNLNGSSVNSAIALTLERNTTITSASFEIGYSHLSPSPGTVTLDIAEDGQYEWAWMEVGFGDLGNQTTFSDGSSTNSSSVDSNGAQLEMVYLPSVSQLQTADLSVEYSPDFGGSWVATGMIDDLEVGDIDADNRPEPIFLQREHTWPNGSSSPAIGYFDWTPSTGFSAVSWKSTCDGATTLDIGDFDGDGRADIAATDPTNESACIHISLSTGGWGDSTNLTLGQGLADLAVGDFDGDGDDELVSVHSDGTLREYVFNPANGSFGTGATTTVNSNGSGLQAVLASVTTGQFWGSGNATVAVSDGMDGHVSLWNSSGGSWVQLITNTSFDCIKSGLMTLDWNGDGLLDLLGSTDLGVCISTFNGSGWSIQLDNSTQLNNHTVGDWNGNGSVDLLQPILGTPDNNDATFTGYLDVHSFGANGSVATSIGTLAPHTAPREVLLADLDGDGLVEQLVTAGEATKGLYLAGWHSVSFDFDGDGQEEGSLIGYAGDGQNGVDELTWVDMGNISQSLTSKISWLPGQIFPYGIEMAFVMPDATSTGSGTILLKDLSLTYDATFVVDANLMLGNLTNALNLQMLPGAGPFNVALPFNSSDAGTLTLEALQIEWVAGMSNQVFREAPVIHEHQVMWDPGNATHRVFIMWNDAAMLESDFLSYQIFRWVNGSTPVLGAPHHGSPFNGTMDDDNVSGTTWDYRVRAVYSNGILSNLSDAVTITVPPLPPADVTPPDSVTGLTAVDTASDNGGYIDVAWTESASDDVAWYAVYLEVTPITDVTGLTEVANVSTGASTSLSLATLDDVTDHHVAVVCGDLTGNVNWAVVSAGPVQSLNNSVRGALISVEVVTGSTSGNSLADALVRAGLPIEIRVQLESEGIPLVGEAVAIDLHTWGSAGIWNTTSQQVDSAWVLSGVTDSAGEASWNWSDWVDLQAESPTLFNWVSQVTASYGGGSWSSTQQTVASASGSANFESRIDATLETNVSYVQLDQDGEGSVTVILSSANSVEQPLLRGIVVEWSLGNQSNQATASNGQVSVGIDGTAEIQIHYPQGGELDLTIDTSTLQWLDLPDNDERVTLLPPLQDGGDGGGGGNQNQSDSELLPLEMTCDQIIWNLRENGSASTLDCTVRNPNQVQVTVDVTISPPTGMYIFFAPSTSFLLSSNQSNDNIELEMRALFGAPAGDRQLQVVLTASAGGYTSSDNTTIIDFTVIPLTPPIDGGGSGGGDSAGMSTTMMAAIALVVLALLIGGFIGLRTLTREDDEEEEEEEDEDWHDDYDDPEDSTADYRRAPPRDTKPLDDEYRERPRPRGWSGEEGSLPSRGKTGVRPSSRPVPVSARPHRQEASWDDGYEQEGGGEDDYTASDSYHVDDDGVEWWKDEVDVWWYRYPDEEEWSEFIE